MKDLIVYALDGVDASGVPDEVKILPMGHVHSQKGDFLVDDESFELIQKQFKDRKLDLVIDYEHQTLKDVQAPAGGWIKDIYKTAEAIVARVEWTPKAREYLKNKEYRYLSPVVLCRKSDGKAAAIHSVALTNTPAIDGMFTLVNSIDVNMEIDDDGGKTMELKKLIELLGLSEEATETDVEKAIQAAVKAAEKAEGDEKQEGTGSDGAQEGEVVANKTILGLLGLSDGSKTEDVAASIMALKAGGSPEIVKTIRELQKKVEKKEADDLVMSAMKAGKISAAQKDWALEYALKDAAGFGKFVDKAPAVVPMGKMDTLEDKKEEQQLDLKALKNMGLSEEDIKKYAKMEDEE